VLKSFDNLNNWHNEFLIQANPSDPENSPSDVLVIFLRIVRQNLTWYDKLDKEAQMNKEISGWKLVVGNFFRSPA
jgi:hypothetical protein